MPSLALQTMDALVRGRRLYHLFFWQHCKTCRKTVSRLGSTVDWRGFREEPRKCLKDWKAAYCENLQDLTVFSLTKRGLRSVFMSAHECLHGEQKSMTEAFWSFRQKYNKSEWLEVQTRQIRPQKHAIFFFFNDEDN